MLFFFMSTILKANIKAQIEETSSSDQENKKAQSGLALGAVLPQNVFRTTIANFFQKRDSEFDSEGKKKDLGFTLNASGMVFALEYGFSPNLSLQFKVPVVLSNRLTYEPSNLEKSDSFKKMKEGLDKALPSKDELANRKSTFKFFDEEVKDGTTGLGDIEIGALYNWFASEHFIFSTGLGLRMPTGKYYQPKALRPIGAGLFEVGIRNCFDTSFLNRNLWLSLQHQGEFALNRTLHAVRKETDPLYLPEVKDNKTYYTKLGMSHQFKVQASGSFEAFTSYLKFLSANLSYDYESIAPSFSDGVQLDPRSHLHSLTGGMSISALPYRIPLSLDADYTKALAGSDSHAKDTLSFQLKAYFKI